MTEHVPDPPHDGYGWRTAISDVGDDYIRLRGYAIEELMRERDLASVSFLLITGELPTDGQARVLNALMVAATDHGISPSSTVSRYLAACGVPIQVAIAAGVLTFGDVHGGAGQALARLLQDAVQDAKASGSTLAAVAESVVKQEADGGRRIPGFGHPQHPMGDPRASVLFDLASETGVEGDHIRLIHEMERAIAARTRRNIAVNLDGAMAAALSDLGVSWRLARAFIAVPRGIGLAAHADEEAVREPGWRHVPLSVVQYDGPPARSSQSEAGR